MECIWNTRVGLLDWEPSSFGRIKGKVKELEDRLDRLAKSSISSETAHHRVVLRKELEEVLSQVEIMWKQRGKAQWLQTGDRNTAYFHSRASSRQKKNSIGRLRTQEGQWYASVDEMQHTILEHFENQFRSTNPKDEDISDVLEEMLVLESVRT
ncbi:UNVERIFIED_CONTAM: hypothetical protein Slati_3163500 [Sesamum latifolium]|uniref:Uncharacterized protein n=1 Tax=Sesamum latifolium TaxID=2727402 RepID=A0AAW2V1U4_9LAMI